MKIHSILAAMALLSGCAAVKPAVPPRPSIDTGATLDYGNYLAARFAASEHDLPQAAQYYRDSRQDDPSDPNLLALAFFYATVSGDFNEAGALADEVAAKTPDDRAARLALAVIALKKNDFSGTRKQIGLSAKGPFSALTVSLVDAWAAAGAGDAKAMADDMKALEAQKGAEGLTAFQEALLADYLGDAVDADSAYRKALALGGASPRIVDGYGRFLERAGRTADAKAHYAHYADNSALKPMTEAGLARIAKGTKPDALVLHPQDGVAEAMFSIAASLNDLQSLDVSILYLQLARYLRPDFALADILLADRYEAVQEYDAAIAMYRRVDRDSLYYRMAEMAAALDESRKNDPELAIADLKKLTSRFPDDTESWTVLGDTYRASQDYGEAIAAYDQAVKSLPAPAADDWSLFYARANAEEGAHDWKAAEADLDHALKLSPNQPDVLNYLGYSWVDQGRRIPEALTMLEKARKLTPYNGYIVDSVGWAYYRLGRYADAAKTLEQAVLLVPGDPTINDHFGDALWQAGRKMEARFQWNHALAFGPQAAEKAALMQKLLTGLDRDKPA